MQIKNIRFVHGVNFDLIENLLDRLLSICLYLMILVKKKDSNSKQFVKIATEMVFVLKGFLLFSTLFCTIKTSKHFTFEIQSPNLLINEKINWNVLFFCQVTWKDFDNIFQIKIKFLEKKNQQFTFRKSWTLIG